MLALLALVAGVLVWAAPGSQAQANNAPNAEAGPPQTVVPGVSVTLGGGASFDIDGDDLTYKWVIEPGPYSWITVTAVAGTPEDATFSVPSEEFIESERIRDDDPHKYEIVARLTVTDAKGATDSDTVSIHINRRPVADIQVYAGLRDKSVVDADVSVRGHFPDSAVIDGPGENGNRDNEWDVMEGAYLVLDGSGSTDEARSGRPTSYMWTLVRPTTTPDGYAPSQLGASPSPSLTVAVPTTETTPPGSNGEVINWGDVDDDGTPNEPASAPGASPVQVAETITVYKLPDVAPNAPQTVFYRLTVCDGMTDDTPPVPPTGDITTESNCTNGRTGSALVRIVVHDASSAPKVKVGAALTAASKSRGDAAPQATVGQFTGVENQFIVDAGSAVLLTATVTDTDQASGHTFRWTGAAPPGDDRSMATVRVPADADDGDTIDVSVTVTDSTRISVTTNIQLLVRNNTPPTASGVPANQGSINNPAPGAGNAPVLYVHRLGDGFQNAKDGSTVTLRGVGNDPDGDAIVTAWVLREGPDHPALHAAITAWLDADKSTPEAKGAADGAALAVASAALLDMREPKRPLFELSGALTDTVSFDVPNLENGKTMGTLLLFSVIDSKGASDAQIVYVYIDGDDDPPRANAGPDQQVDPGVFVRLNGSASSDSDVGAQITRKWEYVGATMSPAPNKRSPLSSAEIDELDGWVLKKDAAATGGFTYIVKSDGTMAMGATTNKGTFANAGDNLKGTTTAYPWFDAPELVGFNNLKLTFRLHVKDSPPTDLDGDGATTSATVSALDEDDVKKDLNGDGDMDDTAIAEVDEAVLGLDLNNDGDAQDKINLGATTCGADGTASCAANEANVAAVASDDVVITVVNRYFSGNIPGPDFCTARGLGGPQVYAFDKDKDGVADTCSLNTTRRATVARQNALETLANLNPVEFRNAVNAVCTDAFKRVDRGDDPDDLKDDVCETRRVTPPPAGVDPATAEVFFSGVVTGEDFCTNHSLGGARTYANDIDKDGVADQCSLSTTRREAIARQTALEGFVETFTAAEQTRHDEIAELITLSGIASPSGEQTARTAALNDKYAAEFDVDGGTADSLDPATAEETAAQAEVDRLAAKKTKAARYTNALATECRALGTQDFGDKPSDLARDACAPGSAPTGRPLG